MHDLEPHPTLRNPNLAGLAVALAALALAATGVSPARAQGDPELRLLAEAVAVTDVQPDEWPFKELDVVVQEAVRRAVLERDARAAVDILAAGEGPADDEIARALLWAALSVVADPFAFDCETAAVPSDVEMALLASVVGPDPPARVVSTFGQLLRDRWDCPVGHRVVDSLAEHRAVDVVAAWAPDDEALLELAFSLEGPTPRVLLTQAESLFGIERAAALELAQRELGRRGEPAPRELGYERLVALLDAGLVDRAIALESELGDSVFEGKEDSSEPQVSRSLDLAAAAILAGDPALARSRLQPSAPAKAPDELAAEGAWEQRQQAAVDEVSSWLEQALEMAIEGADPDAEDPFDLLAELALAADHVGGDLSSRGTLLRFLGQLSGEVGYPEFAGYFESHLEARVRWARSSLEAPPSEVVRSLAPEIRSLLDDLPAVDDAPLHAEAPPARAPEEERVPAGYRIRPLRAHELGDPAPADVPVQAPGGFGLVRADRTPELQVVLATSQALDPVGELSPGGYWILLSTDGGGSWEAWPTGLRVGFPYEAVAESLLPLLTDDGLAIEVRWARIEEGSISFPPVGLAVERHEDALVVEIPWAVLRADRDGDGLSDLGEERLLTDPHRADTDGDGVGDLDDLLPGVAYSADAGPASEALEALLGQVGDEEQRAILPRCAGGRPGLCFGSSSPGVERTLFVVGRSADWAGLVPPRRTIVLSPEEHREAEARFGPIYATRFPLVAVDRAGGRAVIVWTRSWQGGAALVERTEQGWVVHIRSSWIT